MKRTILFLLACFSLCLYAQQFSNIAEENQLDFSYLTTEYGGGVSFVDFNQDGYDDLSFATGSGQPARFFKNTGSGFEEIDTLLPDTANTKQLLWVDYNNDKELDLFVSSGSYNALYRNNGNLDMEDVTAEAGFEFLDLISYCSVWLDYDRDGKLDLITTHRTPEETGGIDLYRNVDLVHFEKMTVPAGLKNKGESVLALTSFDYDNDGWEDVFLAQDWATGNTLLKNNGNGTFSDVSTASGTDYEMNSMTATVIDINQDGMQDLYVSNTTEGDILLVNDGAGHFTEQSEAYNLGLRTVTFGTVFFDADNDGDDDMHVGGLQVNYTFEKPANEPYQRRNNEWGLNMDNQFNNGVAIGDTDNDGLIDIVKSSVTRPAIYTSKNSLWQNQFSGNNYIKIKAEGTIGNHFAVGAKITVHTGEKAQLKRIGCGESFSSQHSLLQHFGVGQHTLIDSITVAWVSGNVSVVTDVPVNQILTITELPYGCTDLTACNFSPDAQADNGTCRYPRTYYECYRCINDADEDGVCDELEIYGCDEREACNFSTDATENDGSCYYLPVAEISGPQAPAALTETRYTYPLQAGNRCTWQIENGSVIAGYQSGKVTVLWFEQETGTLTVQETDANGCIAETVKTEVNITAADINTPQTFNIFPNPATDYLTVNSPEEITYRFTIYNSSGQRVQQGTLTGGEKRLSILGLRSGLYVFSAESASEIQQRKIFVEKR